MEFGKLSDISGVNWTLPPDDLKVAPKVQPSGNKILVGSPAWGSKFWLNKIYPKGCSPDQFLYYYSRQFNCIELNYSHYRFPDLEMTSGWLTQIPKEFIFCPKVNKEISHKREGLMDPVLMGHWLRFIESLGDHLGPCFIQFHELFSYEEKYLLFNFIEAWPKEFKLSVELRHPSWFSDHKIIPGLADYFLKKGIGLVTTDVAGRRDVLHGSQTTNWSMVRLIGNDLDKSDEMRLKSWAEKLKVWGDQGIEKTYLFLHQPDDILTLEFAQMTHRIFTEAGISGIPSFEFYKERDLFNF